MSATSSSIAHVQSSEEVAPARKSHVPESFLPVRHGDWDLWDAANCSWEILRAAMDHLPDDWHDQANIDAHRILLDCRTAMTSIQQFICAMRKIGGAQ